MSKCGKVILFVIGKVIMCVIIGKCGKSKIWFFLGGVDIWGRVKGDLKKIFCKYIWIEKSYV